VKIVGRTNLKGRSAFDATVFSHPHHGGHFPSQYISRFGFIISWGRNSPANFLLLRYAKLHRITKEGFAGAIFTFVGVNAQLPFQLLF
jgi:hypothetical protein